MATFFENRMINLNHMILTGNIKGRLRNLVVLEFEHYQLFYTLSIPFLVGNLSHFDLKICSSDSCAITLGISDRNSVSD